MMDQSHKELEAIARRLVQNGKGVLAADEINATMGKRFAAIGVENTSDNRRKYRSMLFSASNSEHALSQYISGIILNHETFHQVDDSGKRLVDEITERDILPGIKLDLGVVPIYGTIGEHTAQGLDDLNQRCKEYKRLGAHFAKWRCVYEIQDGTPSQLALEQNANVMARYASICQQNGIVPIVEPEILRDGHHELVTNQRVTEQVLSYVYKALRDHHVFLEGTLLKPNMVTAGQNCSETYSALDVAVATVRTLQRTVPCAVPGIVFLSGGQSEEEATMNLNAMNQLDVKRPWKLSFSFARALQMSALEAWKGSTENIEEAQRCILKRAQANSLATLGKCC